MENNLNTRGYTSDFDIKTEADRMMLCLDLLSDVKLESIIAVIRDAHNVGWFLDPTAYRDALQRGDMDKIGKLATALLEPMKIYHDIRS